MFFGCLPLVWSPPGENIGRLCSRSLSPSFCSVGIRLLLYPRQPRSTLANALELAYSTLWLPFGKGRGGARLASKLTQGFHRQHVLGHKASTPDRTDLIAQIEGGRANLFERAFVEGNISKENFKYFQEFGWIRLAVKCLRMGEWELGETPWLCQPLVRSRTQQASNP